MPLTALFFYIFSGVLIGSALMVISAKNPVHAVLFLILAFFNAAGLFLMLGAEFLAMVLIIVYVGAVAVLFLFVVMMLDVDFAELRSGFLSYLPVGALIGLVLLMELVLVVGPWGTVTTQPETAVAANNTREIGLLLYTKYFYFFEVAGLVLLVAMVGAIILTLRQKEGVKRQSISAQVARSPKDAIEIRTVEPGAGL
ncbi:MAG: NADH-quinone oxidoreductase subunit J [Methyloligellaceae bacterium]